MPDNDQSTLDVRKIERLAKKASEKAIAKATAYLHKTARNSIKKAPKGKERKYDLKIKVGKRLAGTGDGKMKYETEVNAREYLNSPDRKKEKIVMRGSRRRSVRNPLEQGTFHIRKRPATTRGKPPYSHKANQPGWMDYWLKKSIRFDPKEGIVYLNPANQKKGKGMNDLPQTIEEGGHAVARWKVLEGYYAYKTYFKNGKVNVNYTPIYSKWSKRFWMHPRPFLMPALKKAAEKLLKILKGNIK